MPARLSLHTLYCQVTLVYSVKWPNYSPLANISAIAVTIEFF